MNGGGKGTGSEGPKCGGISTEVSSVFFHKTLVNDCSLHQRLHPIITSIHFCLNIPNPVLHIVNFRLQLFDSFLEIIFRFCGGLPSVLNNGISYPTVAKASRAPEHCWSIVYSC